MKVVGAVLGGLGEEGGRGSALVGRATSGVGAGSGVRESVSSAATGKAAGAKAEPDADDDSPVVDKFVESSRPFSFMKAAVDPSRLDPSRPEKAALNDGMGLSSKSSAFCPFCNRNLRLRRRQNSARSSKTINASTPRTLPTIMGIGGLDCWESEPS